MFRSGRNILIEAAIKHREAAKKYMESPEPNSINLYHAEQRCADRIMALYVKKYCGSTKGGL